jgi:excisionase family DNA binding protein
VGAAGFEPTTLGFGGEARGLSGGRNDAQPVGIIGAESTRQSDVHLGLADSRKEFAAHLLPASRMPSGDTSPLLQVSSLMTVRQVARVLRVCTATVYRLCERGDLPHVRVSNAVRISAQHLASYLTQR